MSEQKRYQSQTLNSDDYKKTEEGAQLLKDATGIVGIIAVAGVILGKNVPKVIKGIRSILRK